MTSTFEVGTRVLHARRYLDVLNACATLYENPLLHDRVRLDMKKLMDRHTYVQTDGAILTHLLQCIVTKNSFKKVDSFYR